MLKVILIAFLIAGCTCAMYNENAYDKYEQSKDAGKVAFPVYDEVANQNSQNFKVTRENEGIVFQAVADKDNAFSFKTSEGKVSLWGFTLTLDEDAVHCTIQFDMGPTKIFITSDVFSAPVTEELMEHAKTHALNLQPIAEKEVRELRKQPDQETKHIELNTQWILDVLEDANKPLYINYGQDNSWTYLSPPSVMSADVLGQLTLLKNTMQ